MYCGKTQLRDTEYLTPITISPNTTDMPPVIIRTTGPNYFQSVGKIYALMWSEYSTHFQNFSIEMSVDELYWEEIPIYRNEPDLTSLDNYSEIGLVDMDKLVLQIFCISNVQPQTLTVPGNVTRQQIISSFHGDIHIKLESSPRDRIVQMLITLTLWGVIIRIIDMIFLRIYY
jgi:hypothetical protein